MKITHLTMPPLNTTLIGVLKGAAAYFGLAHSDPMLFGASGHAFLINVHEQLCPSGPYCWNTAGFDRLIGNLGVRRTDLGFFGPDSRAQDRGQVEAQLRSALDQGIPCALLNLENQLITGYIRQLEGRDTGVRRQPRPMVERDRVVGVPAHGCRLLRRDRGPDPGGRFCGRRACARLCRDRRSVGATARQRTARGGQNRLARPGGRSRNPGD